jgi:hypothetical protein
MVIVGNAMVGGLTTVMTSRELLGCIDTVAFCIIVDE